MANLSLFAEYCWMFAHASRLLTLIKCSMHWTAASLLHKHIAGLSHNDLHEQPNAFKSDWKHHAHVVARGTNCWQICFVRYNCHREVCFCCLLWVLLDLIGAVIEGIITLGRNMHHSNWYVSRFDNTCVLYYFYSLIERLDHVGLALLPFDCHLQL